MLHYIADGFGKTSKKDGEKQQLPKNNIVFKQMVEINARLFNESHRTTTTVNLSTYMPEFMCKLLMDPRVQNADHVIGPIYKDKNDVQVGVTGGVHDVGETFPAAAIRELGEEIGIAIDQNISNFYVESTRIHRNRRGRAVNYLIPFNNCIPINIDMDGVYISGNDDKSKKIGAMVVIKSHEMDRAMQYLDRRVFTRLYTTDDIKGVGLVNVGMAREHYRRTGKC